MPPFERVHRETYSFTHPVAGGLAQVAKIEAEGLLFGLQVRVANYANAANAVVSIQDQDGYEIATFPVATKNTNQNLMAANVYLPIPVDSGCSMVCTLNAAAGAGTNTTNVSEAIAWIKGLK